MTNCKMHNTCLDYYDENTADVHTDVNICSAHLQEQEDKMAIVEVNYCTEVTSFEDPRFLTENEIVQGMVIDSALVPETFDFTIFGDEEETIVFLPEVQQEVEITSTEVNDCPDDSMDKTFIDLDQVRGELLDHSDYGSECGSENTSDMDLSRGSLDLSQTGPNASLPSTVTSSYHEIRSLPARLVPSPGYHPNGHIDADKPFYPSPDIPVPIENNHEDDFGSCLDLSKTGPYSAIGSAYRHCSGGSSVEISRLPNGVVNNHVLDQIQIGTYFQLPRIKLEPGLGIDPTIVYKQPIMDYNHNHSDRTPSSTTLHYEPVYAHHINGCVVESCDTSRDGPNVSVEEVNTSRIPLTVTSAAEDDDENDSGTESIDSKDSDSSIRLSMGADENGNNTSKEKSDRKRPGRKKGQVSKVYHLWEFIRDVLNDPRYCGKVIKWENEDEGIFRVVQSEVAATMWGAKKKNRTKMTYEKMSRSIRYSRKEGYFDDIPKDKGYPKKLCFKFGKKAHGWNMKRLSIESR